MSLDIDPSSIRSTSIRRYTIDIRIESTRNLRLDLKEFQRDKSASLRLVHEICCRMLNSSKSESLLISISAENDKKIIYDSQNLRNFLKMYDNYPSSIKVLHLDLKHNLLQGVCLLRGMHDLNAVLHNQILIALPIFLDNNLDILKDTDLYMKTSALYIRILGGKFDPFKHTGMNILYLNLLNPNIKYDRSKSSELNRLHIQYSEEATNECIAELYSYLSLTNDQNKAKNKKFTLGYFAHYFKCDFKEIKNAKKNQINISECTDSSSKNFKHFIGINSVQIILVDDSVTGSEDIGIYYNEIDSIIVKDVSLSVFLNKREMKLFIEKQLFKDIFLHLFLKTIILSRYSVKMLKSPKLKVKYYGYDKEINMIVKNFNKNMKKQMKK